jgi:sucrose-6-phosphate hydrolase SacC (GH32 family)
MDQHGCGENDPNGPVYDPVHGVIHHFYQIHLAAIPGHGPDYGHFVSKDFVNWAAMPVAIWNGLDNSVEPWKVTKYDNEAIFTGSAVLVDGAAPDGKGKGIVNIYPGLCNKNDWPSCETGTLLAQAVPADYANDELLEKWEKPSYNPIMENTQRDPATPWKTQYGEYRLRTYDSNIYGTASAEDMLAGKWYKIGKNTDFRQCECPSFYPLPAATPGTEDEYNAAVATGTLPTHVHKTSCGGDWWQMGTYTEGKPKELGSFAATPSWEDVWAQMRIDQGAFYASKDNEYPSKKGNSRRINWGWAQVAPASTQTLPREITFNINARTLQQYPIEEISELRGDAVYEGSGKFEGLQDLKLEPNVAKQSEIVANFLLPDTAADLSIIIGKAGSEPSGTPVSRYMEKTDMPGDDYSIQHHPKDTPASVCQKACDDDEKCAAWTYVIRGADGGGDCCLKSDVKECPVAKTDCTSGAKKATTVQGCGGSSSPTTCTISFTPSTNASAPYYEVPVMCDGVKDTLRLLHSESHVELRIYSDTSIIEAFFQGGRVAMTVKAALSETTGLMFNSTAGSYSADVTAYPIRQIWTTPDNVRKAPRIYH